jgi:hypothetical protein
MNITVFYFLNQKINSRAILKNNDSFFIIILTLMGLTGGFCILSNGVPFEAKFLYSLLGLIIGLIIGIGFSKFFRWKQLTINNQKSIYFIFVLLATAPIFWAYWDFEEQITSKKGLIIMLIVDVIALALLTFLKWNNKKQLIPLFITIPIWQTISLYWFICMTWKQMNYWD